MLKRRSTRRTAFEARIKELVENEQVVILHRRLLAIVRDDAVCRRLMTTPRGGTDLSRHRRRARALS